MTGFLIEYHRPSGDWSLRSFDGEDGLRRAMNERFRLEEVRVSHDFEVVVITADSLESLRRTHSRYFNGEQRPSGFSEARTDPVSKKRIA